MQIKDIMSRDVLLCHPDDTIRKVARIMRANDLGAVPCGENDRLVGVVTDRDICCRAVAEGLDPDKSTAREVMTSGVTYCHDDEDVSEAAHIMEAGKIRRLCVLNSEKRLVGMISIGDIAQHAPQHLAGEVTQAVSEPMDQSRAH